MSRRRSKKNQVPVDVLFFIFQEPNRLWRGDLSYREFVKTMEYVLQGVLLVAAGAVGLLGVGVGYVLAEIVGLPLKPVAAVVCFPMALVFGLETTLLPLYLLAWKRSKGSHAEDLVSSTPRFVAACHAATWLCVFPGAAFEALVFLL